jgi:hypothetical protein
VDRAEARRIVEKIKSMREDLAGDVKRLTNFTPEYRLRVGITVSYSNLKTIKW